MIAADRETVMLSFADAFIDAYSDALKKKLDQPVRAGVTAVFEHLMAYATLMEIQEPGITLSEVCAHLLEVANGTD